MKRKFLVLLASIIAVFGTAFASLTASAAPTPIHHHLTQNQQLKIKKITYFYVIHDAPPVGTESGYALNDPGGSTLDGQDIQLWSEPDTNEGFAAVFQGTTNGVNFYHLQMANGMCLGVPAAGVSNGTKVFVWECANAASQNWADSSYYRNGQFPVQWLSQKNFNFTDGTGYGIDVTNDYNHDGTAIQVWNVPGGDNSQVWVGP